MVFVAFLSNVFSEPPPSSWYGMLPYEDGDAFIGDASMNLTKANYTYPTLQDAFQILSIELPPLVLYTGISSSRIYSIAIRDPDHRRSKRIERPISIPSSIMCCYKGC